MLVKLNIKKEKYYSHEFDCELKRLLMKDEVINFSALEQNGHAKTTSHLPNALVELKNFKKIIDSIVPYINVYKSFTQKKHYTHLNFNRIWVNEMFKGCSGKIHKHNGYDGTAIFYYKVPKQSSHFVTIDYSFTENNTDIENYSFYDKSYIRVSEGDLIIHDSETPHGISEHPSDESRICFVFDFKFS